MCQLFIDFSFFFYLNKNFSKIVHKKKSLNNPSYNNKNSNINRSTKINSFNAYLRAQYNIKVGKSYIIIYFLRIAKKLYL